jgi:hypothetical protein
MEGIPEPSADCFSRTLEEVAYVFNDYEEGALDRHSSGKKDLEIEHDNVAPTAEKTKV